MVQLACTGGAVVVGSDPCGLVVDDPPVPPAPCDPVPPDGFADPAPHAAVETMTATAASRMPGRRMPPDNPTIRPVIERMPTPRAPAAAAVRVI